MDGTTLSNRAQENWNYALDVTWKLPEEGEGYIRNEKTNKVLAFNDNSEVSWENEMQPIENITDLYNKQMWKRGIAKNKTEPSFTLINIFSGKLLTAESNRLIVEGMYTFIFLVVVFLPIYFFYRS